MPAIDFPEKLYNAPSEWGDCGYPLLMTEDEAEAAADSCSEIFETAHSIDECVEYDLIRPLNAEKAIYRGGWHSDDCQRNRRRWICVVDADHRFESQHETVDAAVEHEIPAPTNLEELVGRMQAGECWNGAPMKHGELDWSNLPTFGSQSPADTCGVWSWDAESVLVGDCADDLRIESREEW